MFRIKKLTLNPSQIDRKKVTQSISSYSMRLKPEAPFVQLLKDKTSLLMNETVEIWVGRVGIDLDFSGYQKLNDTKIRTMSYKDGSWNIRRREAYDLMTKEQAEAKLEAMGVKKPVEKKPVAKKKAPAKKKSASKK